MPILTFQCPACSNPLSFEYADYDFCDFVKSGEDHFEILDCTCGKRLKTVPWVAVIDEEKEEVVTYV